MTSTTRERLILAIEDGVTARPVNGKRLVLVHDQEFGNTGWVYAAFVAQLQPYGPRLRYNVQANDITISKGDDRFAYWRFESQLDRGRCEVRNLDDLVADVVDELVPIPFDDEGGAR